MPSFLYARARCGALPLAALFLACALSYSRAYAQAPAGPAAPARETVQWVAQLRSPDIAVRGAASANLLKAGPAVALPAILPQISQQRMRVPLLRLVGDMGPKAVAELVRLTDDPALGAPAADALSLIARPNSWGQIPGLAACMTKHPELRDMCGRGLALVSGPAAAGKLPILLGLAREKDPGLKTYALLAMARIGPAAAAGAPEAVRALQDGPPALRVAAARALGAMRCGTPDVRAALKAAVANHDRETALAAEAALQVLPKGSATTAAPKPAKGGKVP